MITAMADLNTPEFFLFFYLIPSIPPSFILNVVGVHGIEGEVGWVG